MHSHTLDEWRHEHVFLGARHEHNERRTWLVVALTGTAMLAEIAGGTIFGSMALLADGWHMATHAAALAIAAFASATSRASPARSCWRWWRRASATNRWSASSSR
jgi:Co/Zn/Cd efflux system component